MASMPPSFSDVSFASPYGQQPMALSPQSPQPGGWKITVGNLSRQVSDVYLHSLFSTIGTVVSTTLHFPALPSPTGFAEVVFATRDEARNAMTMTGCSVCGSQITITHAEPTHQSPAIALAPTTSAYALSEPEKRNLYVLNLPLDVSNEELVALFSPYGQVSHACVLAILDSCARRRGFILMGTGEEATRAMKGVHGRILRDYCVDVSFSVIQKTGHQGQFRSDCASLRYRGPEDSLARHNRALSRARPPLHHYESLRALMGNSAGRVKHLMDGGAELGAWIDHAGSSGSPSPEHPHGPARQEGTTLIVDNLCPMVFQASDDLNPVFASFGELVDLSLFPSTSPTTPNAAVVIYRHRHDAEAAQNTLHGQVYSDREIRVTLVDVNTGLADSGAPSPLEHAQYDGRLEEASRPSPRPQHVKSATAPLAPLGGSALSRPMAFDPFSPLSSPRPTRLAHPTHIQLPKAAFTPPPHSFVDTLTPRTHYSASSFRLRPGVTGESETETVATEVSSPETYVEEADNESSPEGSIGKWFVRRRSDASIKISAPGDSYVEKTGRGRGPIGDKTARAKGRTGMDDLQKRVHDLAVDEPNGAFAHPLLGTALSDAL